MTQSLGLDGTSKIGPMKKMLNLKLIRWRRPLLWWTSDYITFGVTRAQWLISSWRTGYLNITFYTQVTGRSYTLGQEWDDMKCWDIDSSLILLRLPISNLLKYVMNTTTMIPSPYVSYTYLAFLITWSITELHALQYSIAVLHAQYAMLWKDRWQYWVYMTGMNNSCAIPVSTITCNKMIKSHTAVCQNQFSLRQMWVKTRTNHVW